MHTLIHPVCTCITLSHNIPNGQTLSRLSSEVWRGSEALSIIRVVKWRPHRPLGQGAKPGDIMIMAVLWGVDAILADAKSADTMAAARLQVQLDRNISSVLIRRNVLCCVFVNGGLLSQ